MAATTILLTLLLVSSAQGEPCDVSIIGAGIGGLYSAWRLAIDSKAIAGNRVCIFEAKDRPGGRIITVHNPVPRFEGYTVDLGAYRYHRQRHKQTRILIEDILGIPFSCYRNPLDAPDAKCPASTKTIIFDARGVTLGLDGAGGVAADILEQFSPRLPYRIDPLYQWGPNLPNQRPRSLFSLVTGSDSIAPEIAGRWDELLRSTTYKQAMVIVDEILARMRVGSYNGIPYGDTTFHQLMIERNWTNEEIAFQVHSRGLSSYQLSLNIMHIARLSLRSIALGKEKILGETSFATPARLVNGVWRRAGLDSVLYELLKRLKQAGVRVQYGAKLSFIERVGGRMRLRFANGTVTTSASVIANIGKPDLVALGMESEPLKSGSEEFRRAVVMNDVHSASKMYCFWEDAWWITKMRTTNGQIYSASESFHRARYHDGHVICMDVNQTRCRGGMLVSYNVFDKYGSGSAMFLQSFTKRRYSPLTNEDNIHQLAGDSVTGSDRVLLDDIWGQIKRVHRSSLAALGLDADRVIQRPSGCVYADWREVSWHSFGGSGMGTIVNEKIFVEPVPGVSLVNEAWSDRQGWMEGSLNSAERALYHVFKLPRPSWMDKVFHTSMIHNFNFGSLQRP